MATKWKLIDEVAEKDTQGEDLVCEMATRRPIKTGLPMTIWIDDGKYYIKGGHWKRVKFQLDKGDPNSDQFGVMDLDGVIREPQTEIRSLHASDLTKLRNFIHNNKKALEHLADVEIDIDDIWPYIIKGGIRASKEQIDALNAKVDELLAAEKAREENAKKPKK